MRRHLFAGLGAIACLLFAASCTSGTGSSADSAIPATSAPTTVDEGRSNVNAVRVVDGESGLRHLVHENADTLASFGLLRIGRNGEGCVTGELDTGEEYVIVFSARLDVDVSDGSLVLAGRTMADGSVQEIGGGPGRRTPFATETCGDYDLWYAG